jgi:hypothetical protein
MSTTKVEPKTTKASVSCQQHQYLASAKQYLLISHPDHLRKQESNCPSRKLIYTYQ